MSENAPTGAALIAARDLLATRVNDPEGWPAQCAHCACPLAACSAPCCESCASDPHAHHPSWPTCTKPDYPCRYLTDPAPTDRENRCDWYAVDGDTVIYCDLTGVHGHNGEPPPTDRGGDVVTALQTSALTPEEVPA